MIRAVLFALALVLASCAPLVYQSTALPDVKGARGYSINAMYGAGRGDIANAREALKQFSRSSCGGEYTVISEQNRPDISPVGDSELIWIVRCSS